MDKELQKTAAESTRLSFPELDDSHFMIVNLDMEEENNAVNQKEITEPSDQITHSSFEENELVDIPISDEPVKFIKKQMLLSLLNYQLKKVRIIQLFEVSKMRLIDEVSKNNLDSDIIKFI